MAEAKNIQITQQVTNDLNIIMGESFDMSRYQEDIGVCFGTVDYGDKACQGCICQAVCSIYAGEAIGVTGLRELTPVGSHSTPDAVKAKVIAGKKNGMTSVAPPAPVTIQAPSPPIMVPPITGSKKAPALPPLPGPVAASGKEVSAPPPPPNPELSAGLIPADGSPPAGWPDLDRDSLAKICIELGYDKKKEVNFRQPPRLIKQILAKRPEWKTPNMVAEETEESSKESSKGKGKGKEKQTPEPAPAPASLPIENPQASVEQVQQANAMATKLPAHLISGLVNVKRMTVSGSAEVVADWLVTIFGDHQIISVDVAAFEE